MKTAIVFPGQGSQSVGMLSAFAGILYATSYGTVTPFMGDAIATDAIAGMVLGAIAAYLIDRNFRHAAAYALGGAILCFFGIIHAPQLGLNASPGVALGYLLLAGICLIAGKYEEQQPQRMA